LRFGDVRFKDWKSVRLGDVCEVIMGQSPPGFTYNNEAKGLPFFQGKIDFGNIYPSISTWCTKPIKIAQPNDILLSVRAPVGPTNICNIRCCIGRGLAAIRTTGKINYWFLFYYLRFIERTLGIISQGSTFSAISKSQIGNLKIPLPPLPEQKKIAEILSTVDRAIEKVDEAIAKTERLKKGLMQELLTSGK